MSVKKSDNGKYYVKYYYKDKKGNRKSSTKRGFYDEKKAIEFDEEMKINYDNEINVSHLKFKQFVNIYLNYVKDNYKYDTYCTYKNRLEVYIIPYFEKYKMLDLSNLVYSKFKSYLTTLKTKQGRPLKDTNKNAILYTLKSMLTYAKNEYFYKVPCYDYMTPFKDRDIKEPVNILNKDELLKLLETIDDIYIKGLIALYFFTGCRSAEGRGLQWKFIDFRQNIIRFEQIVKTKRNPKGVKFRLEMPKNNNSRKTIPMYKELRNIIYEIYLNDSKRKDFDMDKFVFGYEYPIAETTLKRKFEKYLEINKFPHIKIHGLKHSCITYLASVGVPISDIANYVGETIEVLQRVYIHAFSNHKNKILKAFD